MHSEVVDLRLEMAMLLALTLLLKPPMLMVGLTMLLSFGKLARVCMQGGSPFRLFSRFYTILHMPTRLE